MVNGFVGHDFAFQGYPEMGLNWANYKNFCMNQTPGAESIAVPIDLHFNALTL